MNAVLNKRNLTLRFARRLYWATVFSFVSTLKRPLKYLKIIQSSERKRISIHTINLTSYVCGVSIFEAILAVIGARHSNEIRIF